jgi:hypothetical protein
VGAVPLNSTVGSLHQDEGFALAQAVLSAFLGIGHSGLHLITLTEGNDSALLFAHDEGSATLYDHDQTLASQLLERAADREPTEPVLLRQAEFGGNSLTRCKLAGADGPTQPISELLPRSDVGVEVAVTGHNRTLGEHILS